MTWRGRTAVIAGAAFAFGAISVRTYMFQNDAPYVVATLLVGTVWAVVAAGAYLAYRGARHLLRREK